MKAKIIPDKYFTDNLAAIEFIEPISDGPTKRYTYPIITNAFGSLANGNFYRIFELDFTIDREFDNGYLIRIKGKRKTFENQYYFPKCQNIKLC